MKSSEKKRSRLNAVRKTLLLISGAAAFLFWIICIAFAHIGVSWLWLWPAASAFCFLRWVMLKKEITVPKWIGIMYSCILAVFLVSFCLIESRVISYMTSEPQPGLDYVITLGAAVRDGKPTSPLMFRIEKTAEYLEENPSAKVIASGGKGPVESMSEAECIREHLLKLGIDDSRILLEDRSSDTQENLSFSFRMIPEGAAVGIVSNSYHLYRACRIAEKNGYEVSAIPAVTLLPLGIHYTVREYFAIVEMDLKDLLRSL